MTRKIFWIYVCFIYVLKIGSNDLGLEFGNEMGLNFELWTMKYLTGSRRLAIKYLKLNTNELDKNQPPLFAHEIKIKNQFKTQAAIKSKKGTRLIDTNVSDGGRGRKANGSNSIKFSVRIINYDMQTQKWGRYFKNR